jgi:hypothetical protein
MNVKARERIRGDIDSTQTMPRSRREDLLAASISDLSAAFRDEDDDEELIRRIANYLMSSSRSC